MVRNRPANSGDRRDAGSISGSGRSSGEEMATHSSIIAWDRGASWATVHGVMKSQALLNNWTHTHKGELFFSFKNIIIGLSFLVLHLISETRTSRIMLKSNDKKRCIYFPSILLKLLFLC